MNPRITLLGSQDAGLREWLDGHPEHHERGAFLLLRRLGRRVDGLEPSDRYLLVDTIRLTDEFILDSSPRHMNFSMRILPELYFRCEQENLVLGFAHNHPSGFEEFSKRDDQNELNILHGLCGCLSDEALLVAMILVNGRWRARVRGKTKMMTARHVTVLSDKLAVHRIGGIEESLEAQLRQEAAFGKPFNAILQSLRVAVVGVGGTGSPTATLLARAGVGELILIDGDKLDGTNMNRVRGYVADDIGKLKASSLAEYLRTLKTGTVVTAISEYLSDSPAAIDALSSVDVVFGCTDDQAGRDILNQALYYYTFPLIDVGLTGSIADDEQGIPYLRDHRGRISCILPEAGACLRCQKVVTDEMLAFEAAIKRRPELSGLDPRTLREEFYLTGGGVPAPGVGPFTSATADYGVSTLMDLIRQFRRIPGDLRKDNLWLDFVHLCVHSNEPFDDPNCIYCRRRFLLLADEKGFRLGMPALGKI